MDVNVNDQIDQKKIRDACMAPDSLELKVGAQVKDIQYLLIQKVMLIKNQADGILVNGSLGTVLSFNEKGMPLIK